MAERSVRDGQLARLRARIADPCDPLQRITLRRDDQGEWADLYYGEASACRHTMAIVPVDFSLTAAPAPR